MQKSTTNTNRFSAFWLRSKDGTKPHKYDTRKKEILTIHKHTDIHFNKSFLCKSLMYYSELPGITREIEIFGKFKKELKNLLIKNIH